MFAAQQMRMVQNDPAQIGIQAKSIINTTIITRRLGRLAEECLTNNLCAIFAITRKELIERITEFSVSNSSIIRAI
jgi:hypothetical protein